MKIPFDLQWELNDEWNKNIAIIPPSIARMIGIISFYRQLKWFVVLMRQSKCETLLETVGLDADHTKVRRYSKGMLQRLTLAQALLGDPDTLILDEPCAGLDALGRIEMLTLIGKLKAKGKTIIMNSHILNDMEKVLDEGIIMKNGCILKRFTKADITPEQSLETIFVNTVA